MNPRYLRLTSSYYRLKDGVISINNNNKELAKKVLFNLEYFVGHTDKEQEKVDSEQK